MDEHGRLIAPVFRALPPREDLPEYYQMIEKVCNDFLRLA